MGVGKDSTDFSTPKINSSFEKGEQNTDIIICFEGKNKFIDFILYVLSAASD